MERKSCLLKNRKNSNHLIHVKIFIFVNSVNVSMCYLRGSGEGGSLKALLRFIHTKQVDSYYEASGKTIFNHNILLLKQLHTSIK